MTTSADADIVRAGAQPSRAEITQWLCGVVAELTGVAATTVDINTCFARFGLDSATALIVTDMLSEWLGIDLEPTLLYEYETIAALATRLDALQGASLGS